MLKRLTTRLVTLSIVWIILALLATALLIAWLYRDHIEQHYDAHVFTHVEELIAAVAVDSDGRLHLYREPTDPRFHREQSGWYWQVIKGSEVVARSDSLANSSVDIENLNFDENHDVQLITGPFGHDLRARVVHMSHEHIPDPITIVASAPEMQIADDVADFNWHIISSFVVLALGLSLAVGIQVSIALRSLKSIAGSISEVKAGSADRLPKDFPADVQPLVDEMNSLLDHNETLLKRARSQLADLAHLLNTPLTIIRNEARRVPSESGLLILDQALTMSGGIDRYLTRARASGPKEAFGYRTSLKTVVDDLKFATERMYADREIVIKLCDKGDCRFRGETQDLEEMLGNLLDNACKWAQERVEIRCRMQEDRMFITIEDDGPGIPEDEIASVLNRGRKLDETVAGYGQGLGIVTDIAKLYGGHLRLDRGALGGLRAELELPAAR